MSCRGNLHLRHVVFLLDVRPSCRQVEKLTPESFTPTYIDVRQPNGDILHWVNVGSKKSKYDCAEVKELFDVIGF
jgi:hypothetical protein